MDALERRLRQTNLNMLPILREVLKHRNLTRAAEELHLTQSAVSNSMRRLRDHFGDELLVKHGRKMHLTQKGQALQEPLERALAAVGEVLKRESFDPGTSRREFKVVTADYVTAVTIPRLAVILGAEAPHVRVQILSPGDDLLTDLLFENIDFIISPRQVVSAWQHHSQKAGNRLRFEALLKEPFMCLARKGHPTASAAMSLDDYLAIPHAGFYMGRHTHGSSEQAYLREHAVGQFDRILTSNYTVLPLIAAGSDCIALVPKSLAERSAEALPLDILPAPIDIPPLDLVTVWAASRDEDPESLWFRSVLKRCVDASI